MPPLICSPVISKSEVERLVSQTKWFHTVELVEGVVTPGVTYRETPLNAAQYMDGLGFGHDLSGLRILDVGTYDGPMAFELAQRGADVVAVDIRSPEATGFNVLKRVSGLDVLHVRTDVCELHKHFGPEFDVVLFLGVFYHVKHPIMAFENVSHVLKIGGILHVEGESIGTYFENFHGAPVSPCDIKQTSDVLEEFDRLGVPVSLAFPGTYVHGNNWFLPNRSALHGWMTAVGLDVESIGGHNRADGGRRIIARARKRSECAT